MQRLLSSQPEGQLPSQVSCASTVLLPHIVEQSLSLAPVQPMGQQPSSFRQAEIARKVQATLQASAVPTFTSSVQAMPSEQVLRQAPTELVGIFGSQVSPVSMRPLPHVLGRSTIPGWLTRSLQPQAARRVSASRRRLMGASDTPRARDSFLQSMSEVIRKISS